MHKFVGATVRGRGIAAWLSGSGIAAIRRGGIVVAAIVVCGILIGGITACRSTKKIRKALVTSTTARKDTTGEAARAATAPPRDAHADSMEVIRQALAGLNSNHIDFATFSGHMHVHYQGSDGKDYEFNAVIRIRKDSMIWMSINATLGIEAFRLLITRDSVKILDKLKKTVRLRSVSYLQEQVHLPVDYQTLQDMLMGNPLFLDTAHILYYRTEKKGITLFSVGTLFTHLLTLNNDYTLQHSKVDDTDPLSVRTGDFTYGDYDNSRFSTYRKISVAERSKVDIEMSFKQYKFNEPLSYSFSIPKNYKRR
ncbi:DUF4292 domain-containing protein [Puia dinghuensis]|uniref:DUF4292 domain-containing protein n=1 Tax=Puia dinghuensis TaxID=1792502 RepID=A0A8J2XW90_9BACT|nr:DUF4292 domain-containing protein [Puia dinghuensis]GGB24524.1 hypothetical protein GCM10011511_55550 [Puia dinghuensis]